MKKTTIVWLNKFRSGTEDRRSAVPPPLESPTAADIDPLTGALRWGRFVEIVGGEQRRSGGALLLLDLKTQLGGTELPMGVGSLEVLPWLVAAVRQSIRLDDLVAHVIDYRFAILLRGASQALTASIGARVVHSVENTILIGATPIGPLRATLGGAVFEPASERAILDEALANLDRARSSGMMVLQ